MKSKGEREREGYILRDKEMRRGGESETSNSYMYLWRQREYKRDIKRNKRTERKEETERHERKRGKKYAERICVCVREKERER